MQPHLQLVLIGPIFTPYNFVGETIANGVRSPYWSHHLRRKRFKKSVGTSSLQHPKWNLSLPGNRCLRHAGKPRVAWWEVSWWRTFHRQLFIEGVDRMWTFRSEFSHWRWSVTKEIDQLSTQISPESIPVFFMVRTKLKMSVNKRRKIDSSIKSLNNNVNTEIPSWPGGPIQILLKNI